MSVTYQPSRRKRSKAHGFRKRSSSPSGLRVLRRRRRKERARIAVL